MPSNRAMWIGLMALVPVLAPSTPEAQTEQDQESDPTIQVVLDGRARPLLRLALAPVQGLGSLPPSRLRAVRELEETLRSDLEASGIFAIQGPEELSVLELTGETSHDIDQYRSLGNEIALEAAIQDRDGRLILEGRIVDLNSRKDVGNQKF